MYIFIYIYLFTYIFMYIFIYVYIYLYIYLYIYIFIYLFMCILMYIFIYIYLFMYIFMYTFIYIYICVYACIRVCLVRFTLYVCVCNLYVGYFWWLVRGVAGSKFITHCILGIKYLQYSLQCIARCVGYKLQYVCRRGRPGAVFISQTMYNYF